MSKTLPEKIADQLRRDILRGTLAPGATVKERDGAQNMNVSRTPMREAIRILAQEGLVDLRPARSPIVADPSPRDVSDAMRVLRALEVLSGQLACDAAGDADLARIEALHTRMGQTFETTDPLDSFELDMAFHSAIAAASHNASLIETHAAYMGRLWRARYLTSRQRRNRGRVLEQHAAILTALMARDVTATAKAIDAHLEGLLVTAPADPDPVTK